MILCIAFYHYAVNERTDWDCHAGHIPGDDEKPDAVLGLHCVTTLFLRLLYLGIVISSVSAASAILRLYYIISDAEHILQI